MIHAELCDPLTSLIDALTFIAFGLAFISLCNGRYGAHIVRAKSAAKRKPVD